MAIIKDLVITVNGKDAKVSNNVFLYLGDGAVTLLITVLEKSSIFGSINNATNVVTENNTQYAKVCVLKSNNELVYSDKCGVIGGKIQFTIDKEFIDEIAEVGQHLLQIHMYDGADEGANRLTIPPVTINILQPICDIGHDSGKTP